MAIPVPVTSKDFSLYHLREVTQGTTPAGNKVQIPFGTFTPTGGGISRVRAKNTTGNGQVIANIANDRAPAGPTATSDLLHSHYTPLWEELLGATVSAALTTTASNISVVAPNILRLATGTWPGFVAGDRVYVTGFATNPAAFIGRVTSNVTTDLTLTPGTLGTPLVNEAAGASITVGYAGRFRVGTSVLCGTYELWNALGSWGYLLRGLGCTGATVKFTHPGAPDISWTFGGAFFSPVTSALVNTVTSAAAQYPMDSGTGFGAGLLVNGGGGLLYGGSLFPNVRVQELTIAIARPRKQSGAGGTFGPLVSFVDDLMKVEITIKVCNDCTDAHTLYTDALNTSTLTDLGWSWRDPNGGLEYWYFGACDPSGAQGGGLNQTGEDMFELKYETRYHSTHTMFERTLLN